MADNSFFDESTEQSLIKANIVSKYFWAWANVILATFKKQNIRNGRIAYIDLFAGPGRYKDGTRPTPVRVLEQAIAEPYMRKALVTLFNDADPANTSFLKEAIEQIPGLSLLTYKPQIETNEVGSEIVRRFEERRLIPTFFFV